ncbi:hypothetical protein AMTR_s00006p00245940 [Amborella trichopoda]|uniref:Uncharacterized protein n=3 Tax=Amborella trichopoda TaxID=13333 RepID=W1PFA2_AMBTC|nr:hypothetical protein AMTR_s00006p00245940 [Amborella trichopoda]
MDEQELTKVLSKYLQTRKYLVVLDDIWEHNPWESVRDALPDSNNGSRVLITSRNTDPVNSMGSNLLFLQLLPMDESWELFCRKAFVKDNGRCPEHLINISRAIVKRCDGLPLALVIVGALLYRKASTALAWTRVLDGLSGNLGKGDEPLSKIFSLSYFDLPNYLKPCFLYLCAHPEDLKIRRTSLIHRWVAEGFIVNKGDMTLEDAAEDYLEELVSRSMIQVVSVSSSERIKSFRVHELLREFSLAIAKQENFLGVFPCKGKTPHLRTRRLSFHRGMADDKYLSSYNASKVHSLFFYKDLTKLSFDGLHGAKFIRILVLDHIRIQYLPNELMSLIHLRYLSFCKSSYEGKIPKSLRNLKYLEILDMRMKSHSVFALPGKALALQSLRHLYLSKGLVKSMIHLKMENLKSLQTLCGVCGGRWIKESLGNLTQLRKLRIFPMEVDDIQNVYNSLSNLQCLPSLTLLAKGDTIQTRHNLEAVLQPPALLEKLQLSGKLEKLPSWFGTLRNLTKLILLSSKLNEEGFYELQELPRLRILKLYAYVGNGMPCMAGGFPQLREFVLENLYELEEWKSLEEGSMPCLESLDIIKCPKLNMLPEGLQHIKALQKLRCVGMSKEFWSESSTPVLKTGTKSRKSPIQISIYLLCSILHVSDIKGASISIKFGSLKSPLSLSC